MRAVTQLTYAALAAGVLVLATGCDKTANDKTAGEQLDSTVAQTKQDAHEAGNYIDQKATSAASSTDDAGITASVKTRLAADDELKALDINVDTSGGVVTLKGTAPNADAKARATDIAKVVDGVKDVQNDLTVSGSSAG